MTRGLFFSLDGPDGSGKSTQCRLLVDRLLAQGRDVVFCQDPGGTTLGTRVRELLLFGRQTQMGIRTEALLFMASRAELVDQVIRPALDRGAIVVSDRFLLANVVYQGHAGGLDPKQLWSVGLMATAGLRPELTLVFDVPVEVSRSRGKPQADRLESRDDAYHERVRQGFLAESRNDIRRHVVLDATQPLDQVHAAVWQIVSRLLNES